MDLPKLEDSLFFQKQIMGALIQQLQSQYIQQNLPFDETVIDSLSSDKIVKESVRQQNIIEYSSYTQSLLAENKQCIKINTGNSWKFEHKKQLRNYFKEVTLRNILASISGSQYKYTGNSLAIIQKNRQNSNSYLINYYKILEHSQDVIKIQMNRQLARIVSHNLINLIQNASIDSHKYIRAIVFNHHNQQINIMGLIVQQQQYKLFYHKIPKMLQKSSLIEFNSVCCMLKYYYYIKQQIDYISAKNTLNNLQTTQIINLYQNDNKFYVYLSAQNSTQIISIRQLLQLIELIIYFNEKLDISLGQITYKYVRLSYDEISAIITSLCNLQKSTSNKYSYDIFCMVSKVAQSQLQIMYCETQKVLVTNIKKQCSILSEIVQPQKTIHYFKKLRTFIKQNIQVQQ